MGLKETMIYRWMRDDVEFATDVRNAQGRTAERVGLALISKALNDKDTQAMIFICKTLGRSIGFDEKAPVVNINVGNQPEINMDGLSADEQVQLLNLIRKSKQARLEADNKQALAVGAEILDINPIDDGWKPSEPPALESK
jgi:hypothetical protein